MSHNFDRKDIDHYLYLIAKEYKKRNRANPEAEIILVGGASMMLNYNFRDTTTDIDAIMRASSTMNEIVNKIGDENNLDTGWINEDFKNTKSFSPELVQHSKFYKTFCGCLNVRTVSGAYLIAMKMMSGRVYKKDYSDIIGIIKENIEKGTPISLDDISQAINDLYGDESVIDEKVIKHIHTIFESDDLESLYYDTCVLESNNKEALLKAEEMYCDVITEDNVDNFINHFSEEETAQ